MSFFLGPTKKERVSHKIGMGVAISRIVRGKFTRRCTNLP